MIIIIPLTNSLIQFCRIHLNATLNFLQDFTHLSEQFIFQAIKDLPAAIKQLNFRIKYYPEDVMMELIENITIQVFYTEVKAAILSGDIFCPADTAALLASYSLQVKFGDFDDQKHNDEFVVKQTLLPQK